MAAVAAPALTRADIGVAMGITGTEVTKDAAEMISWRQLRHHHRRSKAVEGLYDNLMKYIRVQMIMLAGFILLFLGAGIFQIANGTPLLPLQVLWINFAIDVLLRSGSASARRAGPDEATTAVADQAGDRRRSVCAWASPAS